MVESSIDAKGSYLLKERLDSSLKDDPCYIAASPKPWQLNGDYNKHKKTGDNNPLLLSTVDKNIPLELHIIGIVSEANFGPFGDWDGSLEGLNNALWVLNLKGDKSEAWKNAMAAMYELQRDIANHLQVDAESISDCFKAPLKFSNKIFKVCNSDELSKENSSNILNVFDTDVLFCPPKIIIPYSQSKRQLSSSSTCNLSKDSFVEVSFQVIVTNFVDGVPTIELKMSKIRRLDYEQIGVIPDFADYRRLNFPSDRALHLRLRR